MNCADCFVICFVLDNLFVPQDAQGRLECIKWLHLGLEADGKPSHLVSAGDTRRAYRSERICSLNRHVIYFGFSFFKEIDSSISKNISRPYKCFDIGNEYCLIQRILNFDLNVFSKKILFFSKMLISSTRRTNSKAK